MDVPTFKQLTASHHGGAVRAPPSRRTARRRRRMNSALAVLAALDGICYAALVFLVSVGLSLIFGVLRVVNVAHGTLYAFGAYLGRDAQPRGRADLAVAHLSRAASWPRSASASCAAGFIERFLLRPLYGRDEVLQLLITFAVFMIMDNLQRLIWGVQPIFAAEPLKLLPNITVFGVELHVLPGHPAAGRRGADAGRPALFPAPYACGRGDPGGHRGPRGVNRHRHRRPARLPVTFIIGASLAALGGALASPTTSLVPGMGADMIVLSFAVAATAGLGQIEGTALTALMIGLARAFVIYISAGVRGAGALSDDGAGAAGAAVRPVRRRPGEEDLMARPSQADHGGCRRLLRGSQRRLRRCSCRAGRRCSR